MTGAGVRRRRWGVAGVVVLYVAAVCWVLHPGSASSSAPHRRAASGPGPQRVVYVMGASIALGFRAGPGEDWPQLVADDAAIRRGPHLVNGSVSATRLLLGAPGLPSYLYRETSVLDNERVSTIVLTDLINDIQAVPHQYDPDVIVAGIGAFVARAHAHRVRVVATTIAPYGGYAFSAQQSFSAPGERCRQVVNAALRSGHVVDGVIDFDRVLAAPGRPDRLNGTLDSGDHLHPNDAGQHAMADAVERGISSGVL